MTDAIQNSAMEYQPTLRERFWRRLGFRFHLGDDPPNADALPGWMRTDSGLNFGFSDRLRLLLTGKLRISTTVHMDSPSPSVCKTRLDWHIQPPGNKRG